MTQIQFLATYRLALSMLLTALTLFAAPTASAREACEAAARKVVIGPVIFKLRDDGVNRQQLATFAAIVNDINSHLKTVQVPRTFKALVGSFGRDAANYRLLSLTHFDFESQGKSTLEIWMHEYGHILFFENLILRHPELMDEQIYKDVAKGIFHQLRFYEHGAKSRNFHSAYRHAATDPDKTDSLLVGLLTTDPIFKQRFLNLHRLLGEKNETRRSQVMPMSQMYQELLADLIPIVRNPESPDQYAKFPFRRLIPEEISQEEIEAFQKLESPDVYDISFLARRHVAKRLATITEPAARWVYYEKLFFLFLDDVSLRYRESDFTSDPVVESRRILALVRSLEL